MKKKPITPLYIPMSWQLSSYQQLELVFLSIISALRYGGGMNVCVCVHASSDDSLCPVQSETKMLSSGRTHLFFHQEYVTGPLCRECKEDAFYIHATNPYGCIPCFCMGVTRQCHSSSWYRNQVIFLQSLFSSFHPHRNVDID